MRLPSAGPAGPAAVNRYLLPHEQQAILITLRLHSAVLIPPAAAAMGGLLVAVVTTSILRETKSSQLAVWILTAFLMLELISATVHWSVRWFVVTSERILLISGVVKRRIAMIPLSAATDMTFERSYSGRVLGYGRLIFEPTSQGRTIIDYVRYSEQLKLEIDGMLFPNRSTEEATEVPGKNQDDD